MSKILNKTKKKLRRSFENFLAYIAVRFCRQIVLQKKAFYYYEYARINSIYGNFRLDKDYNAKHIRGLKKESGVIRGVIVDNVEKFESRVQRVLLPGEYNADKNQYSKMIGIHIDNILTAGIGGDMDYEWNFEDDPPEMGEFDLIISQAMLEHLLNPYKHVADLSKMLNPGGKLILHTHIPGFGYHRYPVDCLRFFPDWFEETASRLTLNVLDRYIGDLRICYTLEKSEKANT
jgi:SAM-dependent methyltransferase